MSTSLKGTLRPLSSVDPSCEAEHLDPTSSDARRQRMLPARTVEGLAETFRVLGDPTRVRILDALASGELCVCDIAALVGISESAVSHQLRLLRSMRLVKSRRDGRHIYYTLDDDHILGLFEQGLEHVQERNVARGARRA